MLIREGPVFGGSQARTLRQEIPLTRRADFC
jgi:hypothetical protein